MRGINATYTKEQNLLSQRGQFYLNTKFKIRNAKNVRGIIPKRKGYEKESGHFECSSQSP